MANINNTYTTLLEVMKDHQVVKDAQMKNYTSFKTGGKASLLVTPDNIAELQYTLMLAISDNLPYYIMGNGTNILVRDGGYQGVIIKIGEAFNTIKREADCLVVSAGALLKDVAAAALAGGLTGLEFASGIPGSMGGAAYMNAGAYDGDMSMVVEEVKLVKKDGSQIVTLTGEDMDYSYRRSVLMDAPGIITSVKLKLREGNPEEIQNKMIGFQERRKQKQPLDFPSGGSFFKRPPGNFAGTLIEKAGLKGTRAGGAKVSELHAGFIINTGDATAKDILDLMKVVQDRVYEKSEIRLEPEIRIIGDD